MVTLLEAHQSVVRNLRGRGEKVYSTNPDFVDEGDTDVYVKARKFGTMDWLSGDCFPNDDGTFNVCPDVMGDMVGEGPFKIEEIGLCDPTMLYANGDRKTYPHYHSLPKVDVCFACGRGIEVCPYCGQKMPAVK